MSQNTWSSWQTSFEPQPQPTAHITELDPVAELTETPEQIDALQLFTDNFLHNNPPTPPIVPNSSAAWQYHLSHHVPNPLRL